MKIKSIISSLCIAALCAFAFQACNDVPAPYDIPQMGDASKIYGTGTLETPYTIRGASLNQNGGYAWVKAYIVGYIPQSTDGGPSYTISDVVFSADGAAASNIVIADNPAETDINNCMAVQLPSGDVRSALNLSDHPENLGQEVLLYGTMERYFGGSGVRGVTAAVFNGQEIGDMPEEGEGTAIFSETFAESLGGFTIDNVKPAEGLGHEVWTYDGQYKCAKATSYTGGTGGQDIPTESWLISPTISLAEVTAATLSFDHACNYFNDVKTDVTVWIREGENGAWNQLDIPTYPTSFAFVGSGDIDLNAYIGKNIQVGFKYVCTTKAGTYEVKNFKIEERNAEEAPDVPEESISVADAIALYDANNAQPNVRVKGYIVGYVSGKVIESGATFGNSGSDVSNTNIMIADDANETDYTKCLTIQLPSGDVRSALNLKDNPDNLGKSVTLLGSLEKYFGTYGLRAVTEYTIEGETPEQPGEGTAFTRVTNVTDGTYIFAAYVDGTYKVAENVAADSPFGYLYVEDATATGNTITLEPAGMTFTITSTADGYTIQDESGRYMYQEGSFNNFNVSESPSGAQYWDIARNANGSFKITNKETGKWMQYDSEYTSFGAYGDERGTMPYLFKMN